MPPFFAQLKTRLNKLFRVNRFLFPFRTRTKSIKPRNDSAGRVAVSPHVVQCFSTKCSIAYQFSIVNKDVVFILTMYETSIQP